DGTLWAWGSNSFGQVGNGLAGSTPVTRPVQVKGLTSVVAAASGGNFGLALRSDGTVWGWGNNNSGQLGPPSVTGNPVTTPVLIPGLSGVVAIAAAQTTGFALLADGTVRAWGQNHYGLLGIGMESQAPDLVGLVQVAGLDHVRAIAAGGYSAFALREDGTVWGWGSDTAGQLAVGYATDLPVTRPLQARNVAGVTSLSAGFESALAVTSGRQVLGWGMNSVNQLGRPFIDRYPVPVVISR
ncbi:MAG: RCC1 repeat- and reductase domain-containing protein, partial [Planctomycetota bacterium]